MECLVVEAFHEHGGELVCGAIVSVRRGRSIEVEFFLDLLNSGSFRGFVLNCVMLVFFGAFFSPPNPWIRNPFFKPIGGAERVRLLYG